jgi:hypothetical protein
LGCRPEKIVVVVVVVIVVVLHYYRFYNFVVFKVQKTFLAKTFVLSNASETLDRFF